MSDQLRHGLKQERPTVWELISELDSLFIDKGHVDIQDRWIIDQLIHLLKQDRETFEHSLRVGRLAKVMSMHLGLNPMETRQLVGGCCLHDIGKVSISNSILNKKEKLTKDEWLIMRRHPLLGARRMERHMQREHAMIEIVALHHERWDGQGYPYGLSGEDIPKYARICAILDAFDCLIFGRPYRLRLTIQEVQKELRTHSGSQFDPYYVDMLFDLLPHLLKVYV